MIGRALCATHPSIHPPPPAHNTQPCQVKKIRVPEALSLLEECPLLHIEDLLPHLPDLVRSLVGCWQIDPWMCTCNLSVSPE